MDLESKVYLDEGGDMSNKSAQLTINYQGQDFLIGIGNEQMLNLNQLYEIAGQPANQTPEEWLQLPTTQQFVNSLAQKTGKSRVIKQNKDTIAHYQIAMAYAQYLSPDFHQAVNEVFKERLEETVNPELGVKRSRQRAINTWERHGKDKKWIESRLAGIEKRHLFTETLKQHGVNGRGYANCTNAIYEPLLDGTATEVKKQRGLPSKANLRDNLSSVENAAIGLAEALAAENIENYSLSGNPECIRAASITGESIKSAIDRARTRVALA